MGTERQQLWVVAVRASAKAARAKAKAKARERERAMAKAKAKARARGKERERMEGKGKEDALCTLNLVPGESVYGEKRISVDGEDGAKTEYRIWNPFRSKIAAAVLGGIDMCEFKPGAKVLYLGAASG